MNRCVESFSTAIIVKSGLSGAQGIQPEIQHNLNAASTAIRAIVWRQYYSCMFSKYLEYILAATAGFPLSYQAYLRRISDQRSCSSSVIQMEITEAGFGHEMGSLDTVRVFCVV